VAQLATTEDNIKADNQTLQESHTLKFEEFYDGFSSEVLKKEAEDLGKECGSVTLWLLQLVDHPHFEEQQADKGQVKKISDYCEEKEKAAIERKGRNETKRKKLLKHAETLRAGAKETDEMEPKLIDFKSSAIAEGVVSSVNKILGTKVDAEAVFFNNYDCKHSNGLTGGSHANQQLLSPHHNSPTAHSQHSARLATHTKPAATPIAARHPTKRQIASNTAARASPLKRPTLKRSRSATSHCKAPIGFQQTQQKQPGTAGNIQRTPRARARGGGRDHFWIHLPFAGV
jgi:hypothetical protein